LKTDHIKLFALLLSLAILSGCSGGNSSTGDSDEQTGSLSSNEEASVTFDSSEVLTYTDTYTATTSSDTQSAAETVTLPPETTTALTSQTTVTTTTPAEATTAVTTAPPVVTIPKVKVPASPGTETYGNQLAAIDASNKSDGYFTAKYTGSSKDVKIQVSKDGKKYAYDLNSNGNTEVFPLQMGSGEYSVFIGENISGTSYAAVLNQKINVSISNSNSVYLYPNQQVNFNQNSAVTTKSAELCAGKSSTLEKIGAIFTYVTDNVVYDSSLASQIRNGTVTVYLPDPDRTLSSGKGICYDYASLFAAMCRAQGIPTRLVKGYVGPDALFHAWNEVYTSETGWITADVKLGNIGFNTLDATFYAGTTNKAGTAAKFTDTSYYKTTYYY
jgi:transglutaminase-like putative cysteine protease